LLPLPLELVAVDLGLEREGADVADLSQRFRRTVGGRASSGNAICLAQMAKNSPKSSVICAPSASWYTRVRR